MFYKEHYFKVDSICKNSVYLKKKYRCTHPPTPTATTKKTKAYSQLANKKC